MTFAPKPQRIQHRRVEMELHKLLIAEPFSVPVKIQALEGRCKLDFFFPDWKLAVEIDGPWHDGPRDMQRDDGLGKMGIAVMRLPADMPVSQMRRNIAYVSDRILLLPLAEKLRFVKNYDTKLLERLIEPIQQQTTRAGPNPLCIDCDGSGWKLVPVFSEFMRQAELRATRCKCENLRNSFELCDPSEIWSRKQPVQETLPLQIKIPA